MVSLSKVEMWTGAEGRQCGDTQRGCDTENWGDRSPSEGRDKQAEILLHVSGEKGLAHTSSFLVASRHLEYVRSWKCTETSETRQAPGKLDHWIFLPILSLSREKPGTEAFHLFVLC